MFFDTNDFSVYDIEVFKLKREPYRKPSQERPFHAISFRVYGNAMYEISDERITTQKGDILFVPAYAKYTKDTQSELFYVIHFKCKECLGDKLRRISPGNPEVFLQLFERLYRVQTEKGLAYEYESKQLFYQLIVNIEQESAQLKRNHIEEEMDKAIQIIHETFMQPDFAIASLVEQINLSETYFRRQFQKMKGVSPKKYVSELRLQMAIKLLRSGYCSASEVASRCGFTSLYYFSSFVKRMSGKSPREWNQEDYSTS